MSVSALVPAAAINDDFAMFNHLSTQRILSIDAFRGITILVMIFVNELAAVQNLPAWMKHMPADADAMTFVDVVFPAFLFIVGMSIPFAITTRLSKGDTPLKINGHMLFRTLGLLVLGFFMVNAESGYNEAAMGMPIALWSLLFYVGVILIWNVYTIERKPVVYTLRIVGAVLLALLAFVYRGGDEGTQTMTPRWWGILGLIGWAYLVAAVIYQLLRGSIAGLVISIAVCLLYYVAGRWEGVNTIAIAWVFSQGGHAIHAAVVLCGIAVSLMFFDNPQRVNTSRRFLQVIGFTTLLFLTGYLLRPLYTISKIYATPTWALYSAGFCCLVFIFLYWLIDLRKVQGWTAFFKPAAANPLLTYIIPFIMYALMRLFDLSWPSVFYNGATGIVWAALFAIGVMAVVIGLNRMKIKLQL